MKHSSIRGFVLSLSLLGTIVARPIVRGSDAPALSRATPVANSEAGAVSNPSTGQFIPGPASDTGGAGGNSWGRYAEPIFGGIPCGNGDGCNAARFTLNADYLLWWMKGDRTSPVVAALPPALGMPDLTGSEIPLLLDGPLGDHARSGLRVSALYWFDEKHVWGIDAGGFFVGIQNDRYSTSGTGATTTFVITRPFFDPLVPVVVLPPSPPSDGPQRDTAPPPATPVLVPIQVPVPIDVQRVHKSSLWGYDINLRRNQICLPNFAMDFLFGFRELGLDERLVLTESITMPPSASLSQNIGISTASTIGVNDSFSVRNRFYGGQVGVAGEYRLGMWALGFDGKVGLGTTTQTVDISGSTRITDTSSTTTVPGGLFAQQGTNIGRHFRWTFGAVPEVGISLGCNLNEWLRLTAGYNFLYWNAVARPGDQVNAILSPSGGTQSAFLVRNSDYFVQGVTFGMQFDF